MENVSIISSAVIMIISSIIFSLIILEKKEFKVTKEKILTIIIGIIIYSLIAMKLEKTVKTLWLCCLYIVLFRRLLKISYSDSLYLSFLYIILTIIPDIIFIMFVILGLGKSSEVFYSNYAGTIIATISVNVMLIMITYICRKWLRKLIKLKMNNNKVIIVYTVLTLLCVLTIFYSAFEDIVIDESLLLSAVVMIVFVVILYSLIKQKIENNNIIERYDKLLEFIKIYEVEIDEQKMIRHESKNQLSTIKSKIVNKEKEEKIIKYIDSILNEHKSYNEEKYGKFQYLPANGLKGLFYYKAMEAEERGIKLSINISSKIEKSLLGNLPTEEFKELCRLIGVYLDNAIEASEISEEKKMGLEIYKHEENIVIIIMNTYSGMIDTEQVGNVKYSTKGKNRGYGLMLVNKILKNYDCFEAIKNITDELYIQKLIIKKI